MNTRRVVAAVFVIAAAGVLAVVLFPGLLVGDPGPYNETTVTVYNETGTRLATMEVRVADTTEKRYTGLSDTDSLDPDEGMLFVHEREGEHSYVMRDMDFPLDIIFIDGNGTVVRVAHASVDGDGAPYEARAKYVLEANRGWANSTGLDEGDTVGIPDHVRAQG